MSNSPETSESIARDSTGRIYNESRAFMPTPFAGVAPLLSFYIYDPRTRASFFVDPDRQIARFITVMQPAAPSAAPWWENIAADDKFLKKEALGTEFIEGLSAQGVRITRTIPASPAAGNQAISVVDEYWYSRDLGLNLLTKHRDPRTGQQTVQIQKINRAEPDAALFSVPKDFKVVDENPPN